MGLNRSAQSPVTLREVTEKDLELLMAWRSHPLIYAGFYWQDGPLSWEEHHSWWLERKQRKDWMIIFTEGEMSRAVGCVAAYELESEIPHLGVYIGEISLWGRSVAQRALTQAVVWLRTDGYHRCRATILDTNAASQRAFKKAGFDLVGPAEWKDWSCYEIDLDRQDFRERQPIADADNPLE